MLEKILGKNYKKNFVTTFTLGASLFGAADYASAQSKSIKTKPTEQIQQIGVMIGTPEAIRAGTANTVYLKDNQTIHIKYEDEIYVIPQAGITPAGTIRSDVLWKLGDKYILDSRGNRLETYVFNPEDHGVKEGQTITAIVSFETLISEFDGAKFYVVQGNKPEPAVATPVPPQPEVAKPSPLPPQAVIPDCPTETVTNTVNNYVYVREPCVPELRDRKIFLGGVMYRQDGPLAGEFQIEKHGKKWTLGFGGTFGKSSGSLTQIVQDDTVDTRGTAGVINSKTTVSANRYDNTEVGFVGDLLFGNTGKTKIGPQFRLIHQGVKTDGYTVVQEVKDASGRVIGFKQFDCPGDFYSDVIWGVGVTAQIPVKKNAKGETTVGIKISGGVLVGGVQDANVPTTDYVVNYGRRDNKRAVSPYVGVTLGFGK